MKRKIFLTVVGVMFFISQVLATGINVYIPDAALHNRSGGVLSGGDYLPYGNNLEFFYNSLPALNARAGRRDDGAAVSTHDAGRYKYQYTALNGGTFYVRVWSGGSPATRGSYYGYASSGVASGTTLPVDWNIARLDTNYKADVPYVPSIGAIQESLVRSGNDLQLKLVVPVSYDNTGGAVGDGIREADSFSIHVVYPDGHEEDLPGSSITLNNTATGTYRFTPSATNVFGTTPGVVFSYTTLAAGAAGGAGPIDFTLVTSEAGLGLNSMGVVHTVPYQVGAIRRVSDLVANLNTQLGNPTAIRAIGWVDHTRIVGYMISYSGDTPSYTPVGGAAAGGEAVLERGQAIQVYTTTSGTVTFSQ